MECVARLRRQYILAVLQHDCIKTELAYNYIAIYRLEEEEAIEGTGSKPWIQRCQEYLLVQNDLLK